MKDIEYKHVVFSYDEEKPLLTDVNFKVPGGKMYAIVGPSGSGKSTVVNLIPRLYDVLGGSVTINGVDVRNFDLKYLRQCIGVVTQESYLFNGTILDNLKYAKSDATMAEIENACKIANIHDFILNQPNGYNTEVGNRGLKLSGGEKQRISLARVILKDPKILILDEATSALDSISENSIQDALEKMMKGRTSIVIAHRLSTILKADSILVVKDGVITEQGTHEELLALNGTYHMLYETQFRQAIDNEKESKPKYDISTLSTKYEVKKLDASDISDVYRLCKNNKRYYRYLGHIPTRESLTSVISEIPNGVDLTDKLFVGYYHEKKLIALMDVIIGYPEKDDAFIGWFMVDGELQGQGIGSDIFADVRATLKSWNIDYVSLGCIENNVETLKFWEGLGFKQTGEKQQQEKHVIIKLAKDI